MPSPDSIGFAVIIPTYNREQALRRAIESVLAQDHDCFRLVVVDDGSVDGTAELLASIRDTRFIHTSQENRGRCAARNRGAALSDESWMLFLDSDDEMLPGTLRHVAEQIREADCDLVIGAATVTGVDGAEPRRGPAWDGERQMPWALSAGSFAIRRTLFESVAGYCETLIHSEHTEMVYAMRSLPARPKVAVTDRPLAHLFVRPDRYDAAVQYQSATHLLEHIQGELAEDREARSMFRGIAGVGALKLGYASEARRHLLGALLDRPRPRAAMRLATAVLPVPMQRYALKLRSQLSSSVPRS